MGTEHRKILRAVESRMPWSELRPALANLESACSAVDHDTIDKLLKDIFEGVDIAEALSRLPRRGEVVRLHGSQ